MSIHLMSKVWRVRFPTHTQFLALMKCADYADDDGKHIYPSYQTIADNINASKRQVQYAMEAIEQVDLMTRVGQTSKGTLEWNINVPLLSALHEQYVFLSGKHNCLELVDKGGAKIATPFLQGGNGQQLAWQPTTASVATDCHQSINNHQEPSGACASASDGSRAARPLQKPVTSIRLTPNHSRWSGWMEHLESTGQDDALSFAKKHQHLDVSSVWPDNEGAAVLSKFPKKKIDLTARMIGEGDA